MILEDYYSTGTTTLKIHLFNKKLRTHEKRDTQLLFTCQP